MATMNVQSWLGLGSGMIVFAAYLPYANDILRHRVKPSRSTRVMLAILMAVAVFQQRDLGSHWTLAVTVGEGIGSLWLLMLTVNYGVGGLTKLDVTCYFLLGCSLITWFVTTNALIGLYLNLLADAIAFTPVIWKTWQDPRSETPLFYLAGVMAPLMSIVAGADYSFGIVLYPLYLAAVNFLELAILFGRARIAV